MKNQGEPQFPFRMVWNESGEVETFNSPIDLLQNLEDFDTDSNGAEASIEDALGRSVNLTVKVWTGQCDFRLADESKESTKE